MAWLSGWLYRKRIKIAGSPGAGAGYQVLLKVGESSGAVGDFHVEGHAADFPNDIRFTDDDGVTLLSYWLEEVTGESPNRVAKFWVKVADSLDSDVDIYCYYGKRGEKSASSGDDTFIAFDDFSTDTKWRLAGSASIDTAQGVYVGKEGGCRFSALKYRKIPMYNIAVEARWWVNNNSGPNKGFDIGIDDLSDDNDCGGPGNFYLVAPESAGNYRIWQYRNGFRQIHSIPYTMPANQWVRSKIVMIAGGRIKYYEGDTLIDDWTHGSPVTDDGGYLGVREIQGKIDWVFVRRYVEPEPVFSSAGNEEVRKGVPWPLFGELEIKHPKGELETKYPKGELEVKYPKGKMEVMKR